MRYCYKILILLLLLFNLVACTHQRDDVDGLHRSRVDDFNKMAFQNRFRDAHRSCQYAYRALDYLDDSLPQYVDGRLRAWNNLATAYYHLSEHDSVLCYVDSVLACQEQSPNREVEQMLAHLLEARLLQRSCDIAGSYQILHDIEHSGLLDDDGGGFLLNLAKSEFYIATIILNYHYRTKSQYQQSELLTELERQRSSLRCDYAEDMSLNYAIAYGYYALCSDTLHQSHYLAKALHYCADNLRIMDDSARYSTYHLGDTYQLIGFMLWGRGISPDAWKKNKPALDSICSLVHEAFGFDVAEQPDMVLAFLREATALFFLHDDPYQRLGAIVSTGRYCMSHGDTAMARSYFSEALIDTTLIGVAPKFEAMLYEGFLTSGCATNNDEVAQWARREIDLLNYIKQNEKADFLLQMELEEMREHTTAYMVFSMLLALLALGLVVSLILLRRRTKALQRETVRLQEAKQHDVERIANVETCLSVLRHDITPFINYLQNDKLPDELKHEVTGQLIRTFENIKNWTNLSIPSGLQFRCSQVSLQELFDKVAGSVNNFRGDRLQLTFRTTELCVRGDRLLLEILLRNLVNNAIQYTEQGTVEVSANVDVHDSSFVELSVSDTGCGMTADEVENLFRTDKKIRQHEGEGGYGSGFGLILCRYIIKKHDDNTRRGCRIWAESTLGQGTTFKMLLEKTSDK